MSSAQNRADVLAKQVDPSKSSPLVSITAKQDGVAIVTINNPPVNSFSPLVANALDAVLNEVEKDASVKAIVLTGQGKTFVAGADIPSLFKMTQTATPAQMLSFIEASHKIVDRMEAFKKPIVAALNGDTLGGGLELAMACHARVAFAKAKLGLPELKLGLIPGMGGTQRLARLVGVQQATQMILSSKPLPAPKAAKAGLADMVVKNPKQVVTDAAKVALGLAAKGQWRRTCQGPVCGEEEARSIALGARVQTKKRLPLPHALAAIDAIEFGALNGAVAGLKRERELFVQCLRGPVAKALIHVFLASKAAGKVWPGISRATAAGVMGKTRAPRSVAIIGGGTMGAGIAVCYLVRGIPVVLKEITDAACLGAIERVLGFVESIVKARKLPSFAVEHFMRGLTTQTSYKGFDKVDMAIEAAVENVSLKQKIMAELAAQCSATCVLATNTSTIDIDVCAAKCPAASVPRVVGLHFFSPAPVMPLVEVITGTRTSPETVAVCMHSGKAIGKTCVVVKSCVGFLANRIFVPYTMTATTLIQAGACPYKIDRALAKFGMPMGPLTMSDSVGLDISVHLGPIFDEGYKGRIYAPDLTARLIKDGRYGQKSGKGFYAYAGRKKSEDWAGIKDAVVGIRAQAAHEGLQLPDASRLTEDQIATICLLPVVNEAARTLVEGVVASEADVDTASIMGYGFPAWRGGVWMWAKEREGGLQRAVKELERISEDWGKGKSEIKEFFRPSAELIALAKKQNK